MILGLRQSLARRAALLSSLAVHAKKGFAWAYWPYSPPPIDGLETACRYAGVSARHFLESLEWFGWAVRAFWLYLRYHPAFSRWASGANDSDTRKLTARIGPSVQPRGLGAGSCWQLNPNKSDASTVKTDTKTGGGQ